MRQHANMNSVSTLYIANMLNIFPPSLGLSCCQPHLLCFCYTGRMKLHIAIRLLRSCLLARACMRAAEISCWRLCGVVWLKRSAMGSSSLHHRLHVWAEYDMAQHAAFRPLEQRTACTCFLRFAEFVANLNVVVPAGVQEADASFSSTQTPRSIMSGLERHPSSSTVKSVKFAGVIRCSACAA